MAIRIKARHGEHIGQMMRRFKKLCEKEGLTKDVKRKQYFEKPSERRRRAARKAVSRLARVEAFKGARPSGGQSSGGRGGSGGPGAGGGGKSAGGGGGGGGGKSGGRGRS